MTRIIEERSFRFGGNQNNLVNIGRVDALLANAWVRKSRTQE